MKRVLAALAVLVGATCHQAAAQEPLNMVGTWKGQATAAHVGANPYRDTEGGGANLPAAVLEFTFVIEKQEGNRFTGTTSAGSRTETIIGALSPDAETGVMLDEDGQYMMTIRDPNTVDVCYFHRVETGRVVACYGLLRQN